MTDPIARPGKNAGLIFVALLVAAVIAAMAWTCHSQMIHSG